MFSLPFKFQINNKCYVADQKIAQGSNAAVYRGYEQSDSKNLLAIKICNNMSDEEFKFIQNNLLRRDHNNIIKYFDISPKTPFFPYYALIMELGQENLSGKATQKLNEVLEISLQISRGLQSLRNLGFIHRNLKPQNILLINDQWKICDFIPSQYTLNNYIAPEMIYQDPKNHEQKMDIWGLGCIIYEIYYQTLLFQGVNQQTINNQILSQHEFKYQLLPETLKKLVKQMLTVNPLQRSSITDVIQQILDSKNQLPENQLNVMETAKPQIQRFPINNQPIQFPQSIQFPQPIQFPQQPQGQVNQFPGLNKQMPQQFSSFQIQPIQRGNLISQQFPQNSQPQQIVVPQCIPKFQQGPILQFPQPKSSQVPSITSTSDQQTVKKDNQFFIMKEVKKKFLENHLEIY